VILSFHYTLVFLQLGDVLFELFELGLLAFSKSALSFAILLPSFLLVRSVREGEEWVSVCFGFQYLFVDYGRITASIFCAWRRQLVLWTRSVIVLFTAARRDREEVMEVWRRVVISDHLTGRGDY
jgi:hypothetical protein